MSALPPGLVPTKAGTPTVTIPLGEYLALQRLVGFALSIPPAKVVHVEDSPPFREAREVVVTPEWRELLVELATDAEERAK